MYTGCAQSPSYRILTKFKIKTMEVYNKFIVRSMQTLFMARYSWEQQAWFGSLGLGVYVEAGGGLGVRNHLQSYFGMKLLWASMFGPLSKRLTNLWVKWGRSVHIKNKVWRNYIPPQNASWIRKSICKTKDSLFARVSSRLIGLKYSSKTM